MNNNVISVYIGAPLKNAPLVFFLEKVLHKNKEIEPNLWNMFQGSSSEASFDFLRIVSNPEDADFLLLPHNYAVLRYPYNKKNQEDKMSALRKSEALLAHFISLAEKYKKKILVFSMTDSDEDISIPHSIIFRYSQYKYKQKENEIITPPYPLHFRPPELSEYRKKIWKSIFLREKNEKPTVSFCGWANFPSFYRRITYAGRALLSDVKKYVFQDKYAELHKRGIFFRRKAVQVLSGSTRLNTNFILRRSFNAQSGFDGKKQIGYEKGEKEYVESILHTDFVLAPKGNGNASVRFFETLSLGRFPVLINTDCELPLKDFIDYDKFVVTVDYTRIKDTEQAILDFYNALDNKEFQERQKMAREAFELLRPGSFLKIALSELKEKQ
ncbi:MAG: exostosin family protein [Parcubacteria group bacterium]|nr:exostosin family protein [Parcubacteria group bacterium]